MLTLHGPVVDGSLGYQGDGVEVDPLPEGDFLHHLVGLHLALHLNVEDLQTLARWRETWEERSEGGRETWEEGEQEVGRRPSTSTKVCEKQLAYS